jgi:hypothetical protein
VEVKGGSYPNPYQQVRKYKLRLANWLGSACKLGETNDLGHISGLVLFTQPVSLIQDAMSPPQGNGSGQRTGLVGWNGFSMFHRPSSTYDPPV